MGQNQKLVSIGFPTYNRAKCIRRALNSLLSQTYPDFELIIADNASVDETPQICKEYMERDRRIRYIRLEKNIGMLPDWMVAFREAKGEYFLWAADDDWWAPEYIATLVDSLEKDQSCDVALCSFRKVYETGEIHDETIMEGKNDVSQDSHYTVYRKVFGDIPVNQFVFGLYRRKFLARVFENPLANTNSWDPILMSEIALATRLCCPKPLLRFVSQRRRKRPKEHYHPIRFPGDRQRPVFSPPYSHALMLTRSFRRVITSRVVPLHRKFLVIFPLLLVLWDQRKRYIGFSHRDFERFFIEKILKRKYFP